MVTVWAKLLDKVLSFLKWCWQNKFTILFLITTIIFLSMYGCKRSEVTKLNDKITVLNADIVQCKSNYTTAVTANKETVKAVDACQKELQIVKDSFKQAEVINQQFEKEIEKFKKLTADIDKEKDPDKQLEMKKKILEELFKGKNAIQIRMILRKM